MEKIKVFLTAVAPDGHEEELVCEVTTAELINPEFRFAVPPGAFIGWHERFKGYPEITG